jgi:hypothetical protein
MIDRQRAKRLFGESLREIGILIVVFVPLDAVFQRERPTPLLITLSMMMGLIFTFLGIIIEAREG